MVKWFEEGNITSMTARLENHSLYKRGVQYVKSFEIFFDLSKINHVTCCFRSIKAFSIVYRRTSIKLKFHDMNILGKKFY